MNRPSFTLLAVAVMVSGSLAFAQTSAPVTTTATPANSTGGSAATSSDSDLVRAAKTGTAIGRKKSRLSITDKDVKKSGGGKPLSARPPSAPSTPAASPAATMPQPAQAKSRLQLEQQVDRDRASVADLTAEVSRLENVFYASDDPDYRDRVVVKAFDQAREQLETARQQLAAAREALDKIATQPSDPMP
jgi:hypothetical protein